VRRKTQTSSTSEAVPKKVKEKETKPLGPAERIKMMLARVPSLDELAESIGEDPLARLEPEEPDLREHALKIEEELLNKSAEILMGSLRFYEVDADEQKPPKEWIDEHGEKRATELFRIAKYAQRSTKDSPVGSHFARDLFLGILGVRAKRQEAISQRPLNVAITQINISAPPKYPELEVIDQGRKRRI